MSDDDANIVLGNNNQIINSNLHNNRVGGVLLSYQKHFLADNNIMSYNGHKDDGGTGYGIASMAGTFNDCITYQHNTTDHNYRKGLDIHDGNHIIISENTSIGDRLYGIAVYNRQFNMDDVVIKDNIVSQDASFRLAVDDNYHIDKQTYYGYSGIQLQTNAQPQYTHYVGSATGKFDITGNTITGIDVFNDEHHTYGIEFRNHEPHMLYDLNITGNTITGKETKYIIGIMNNGKDYFNKLPNGEAGAGLGFGNITISDNKASFDKVYSKDGSENPITLQEEQKVGAVRGDINIVNNEFNITKQSDSGSEMFLITGNPKTVNISHNQLSMAGTINKATFSIFNHADDISTLNIKDNTLSIEGDAYPNMIGAYHKVNLSAQNNHINGKITKDYSHYYDLAQGQTVVLDEMDNVLKFNGQVAGDVYLGSGSDELTILGDLLGSINTHQTPDGAFADTSAHKNTLSLKSAIMGTHANPAKIIGGDGIETIVIDKDVNHAHINTAKAQDVIAIKGDINHSTINTGDGNDTLYLSGLINDSTLNFGAGTDFLILQGSDQSHLGGAVNFSGIQGLDYLRLEDRYSLNPSKSTSTQTVNIKLSDVIHNSTDKLYITGDAHDTVDLGADGDGGLGGFVKHQSSQTNPTYDVYHDGTATSVMLYIDKDLQVI